MIRSHGQVHAEARAASGPDSTVMSPPWLRTMPWAMPRPSPVPSPTGLVVKKGSKIRSRCSAAIPQPSSSTWTTTQSPRSGRDADRARLAERLNGVEHEVQEDLLELLRRTAHRRIISELRSMRMRSRSCGAAMRSTPSMSGAGRKPGARDPPRRQAADVAHDRDGAVHAFEGLVDELLAFRDEDRRGGLAGTLLLELGRERAPVLAQHREVRAHEGERVVDLVRDAGGELAHGGETAGEQQPVAQCYDLREVAQHEDETERRAAAVAEQARRDGHRDARAPRRS